MNCQKYYGDKMTTAHLPKKMVWGPIKVLLPHFNHEVSEELQCTQETDQQQIVISQLLSGT